MRNLRLVRTVVMSGVAKLENCRRIAIDCESKLVYVATDLEVVSLDTASKQIVSSMSLMDHDLVSPDGSTRIVHIQHLPEQAALCIATSCGNILLWTASTNQVECIGVVNTGIRGMEWSPDMELVTIINGGDMLIIMTREFDVLLETSVQRAGFGEAQPITVGWGKKETQFHGSEGKAAAVKTTQTAAPAVTNDDRRPRISWRADGLYFAINIVSEETGARQIRVWSREGELHSTSELTPYLSQVLSYKPSGSLLASCTRRLGRHWVTFFEKNGLRHGEFELPFKAVEIDIVEVAWNMESTVLAVWCREQSVTSGSVDNSSVGFKSYIQLWTVCNYHWYLKQSLQFTSAGHVISFTWDPEQAYRLHVICADGSCVQYTWVWATDCSLGQTSDDPSSVAVIDGNKILMTPFRGMVVPPPMCAYELCLPAAVAEVTFGPSSASNNLLVLLSDARLVIYVFDQKDELNDLNSTVCDGLKVQAAGGTGFLVKCVLPNRCTVLSLHNDSESVTEPTLLSCASRGIHHVTWLDGTTVVYSVPGHRSNVEGSIVRASLNFETASFHVKSVIELESSILAISRCLDSSTVAFQVSDGRVFRYDPDSDTHQPWLTSRGGELRFPQSCPQMAVCLLGGQEVVIGLTDRFRLYVNEAEVANDCTSFAVHAGFLLLTTHAHTVRCISRHTDIDDLTSLSVNKSHVFDESVRSVERGSRLVCVVSGDSKVVLQTPRGNLEVIHPRALVLSAVQSLLDQLDFRSSFEILKKHRVNMNLLYDHDPALFISNAATFVTQLDSAININLFLSVLQEEDVTKTMYTATYGQRRATPPLHSSTTTTSKSKLDTVCDTVRLTMEKIDADRYLLSILTTYVKKTVPELENALQLVLALKKTKLSATNEALTYLMYHIDVNALYNVALGTYDFDLVVMVAEKSQKDPKEYLAYLNELKSLELNHRRYTIDLQLRKFEKALTHISKCPDRFSECLKLITEHKLYRQALSLFPFGREEYKAISIAFGEYLSEAGNHDEAGLVYTRAGENQLALTAFEASLNWQQALCAAGRLKWSAKEIIELSRRLSSRLVEDRKHLEAACLLDQYCNDFEEAIVVLISGNQWNEALRMIYKYDRTDLLETNLKPSLVEVHGNLATLISNTSEEFQRQTSRLEVVRNQRLAAASDLFDGAGDGSKANCDLFSDTSSVTGVSLADSQRSSNTRSSGRTSKSRKKNQKKKWSLREGSEHEDLALIESLHKIVTQAEVWKGDVSATLRSLTLFNYEALAIELQTKFDDFLRVIDSSLNTIWTHDLKESTESHKMLAGPGSTANSITQAYRKGQARVATNNVTGVQLDPVMQFAPTMNKSSNWQLTILPSQTS